MAALQTMPRPQFSFLHVGNDTTMPTILVRSIRAHNPEASIIQCSDWDSPEIADVSRVFRLRQHGPTSTIMKFRLECFAQLDIAEPTLFLDTDMMCLASLGPAGILQDHDVAVCKREFETAVDFNLRFMGFDFDEYAGMTLEEVYPYIGCATITRNSGFWRDALEIMLGLHPKFHAWYGDQEAIRELVKGGKYRISFLPESIYARLPEYPVRVGTKSKIYHFKGSARKPIMLELARKAGY